MDEEVKSYLRVDVEAGDHDAVVCIMASLAGKALDHPEGTEVGGVAFPGLALATVALIMEDDIYPNALVSD